MAEVRCENRHDAIESQIRGVRLPVPNCGFPENGKANRTTWVSSPNFFVLKNVPVAITIRLDRCRGSHLWQFSTIISNSTNTVVHTVSICAQSDISKRRRLGPHWTIAPFWPVIETTAGTFVKPAECAGANDAPSVEQPRKVPWRNATRSWDRSWCIPPNRIRDRPEFRRLAHELKLSAH